ncbi:hypothetical protein RclHR1_27380002 [Rhizophagus clarus]|uniref:Uncharacterized protein n=1 Tax=Rhizophagus clarus TaxID=94130 RepID=A0A2Z6RWH8_9GLOM|nr:hypothetical protein RclHR1_27380002 [Rhizophagus clarus]
MPNNVARRGRGSFNPNSRKASRHERKKDNNNSDNSGSDAADVEVEGPSSPPKENNTASNFSLLPPEYGCGSFCA